MNGAILLVHLVGLGLAVGGAAVKITLLLGCRSDPGLTPVYVRVAPTVTRLLVSGIALLTISGAGWLALGRPLTPWLVAKLALVAAMWVLGPVIDKVVEPAFVRAAGAAGTGTTPELIRARRHHLAAEVVATGLLGAITVLGVFL